MCLHTLSKDVEAVEAVESSLYFDGEWKLYYLVESLSSVLDLTSFLCEFLFGGYTRLIVL